MKHNAQMPHLWIEEATYPEDDCACSEPQLFMPQEMGPIEQDCACVQEAPVSLLSAISGTWRRAESLQWMPLPGDFRLAWSPRSHALTLLNSPGWERLETFGRPRPLQTAFDARLAAAGLLAPESTTVLPTDTLAPTTLTVWLHVTNACNLACPYCYVRKDGTGLSFEQGLTLLEQTVRLARQGPYKGLKVKYAGGEPMLAFDRVQRWHIWLEEETDRQGLPLEAVLLTNGTRMTREQARWLREHRIKVMVSVDGVGETHDRLRPRRDGGPSFTLVERPIDEVLLPMGVRPFISMTLTALNVDQAADMARWAVLERGLPLSFNFYRRGLDGIEDLRPSPEALIRALGKAYRLLEEHLPTWPFTAGLLDRVRLFPHSRTCGVGQHYFALNAQGQVAACHMLLEQPLAAEVSPEVLQSAAQQVHNLEVNQKACAECPFATLCSGGCPLETYAVTGRWEVRNPYCEVYRALIPLLLRLEGLRLMKMYGLLS